MSEWISYFFGIAGIAIGIWQLWSAKKDMQKATDELREEAEKVKHHVVSLGQSLEEADIGIKLKVNEKGEWLAKPPPDSDWDFTLEYKYLHDMAREPRDGFVKKQCAACGEAMYIHPDEDQCSGCFFRHRMEKKGYSLQHERLERLERQLEKEAREAGRAP
jgi:hypothetical protein